MRSRIGIMLSAVLTVVTVVVVVQQQRADTGRPLRDRPDATSKPPAAALVNAYRFQRRPGSQPRGVDPPPDRRLLACDPGAPAGWARVLYQPGMTVSGLDRAHLDDLHRVDGFRQLTIDGCPIYRRTNGSHNDASPIHDTAGTWFVVTPVSNVRRFGWQ
jgi:hypothetical protein